MPIEGPDVLLYEKKGHLVTITMNRPERLNAMSDELVEKLVETWERFRDDDDAWVAILTGAGERAFCAGRDLKERVEKGRRKLKYPFERTCPTGCQGLWKPVIAAVNGVAVAGGWYLAQNCDIRVASENATFGISEVKWNLGANWAVTLPRYVPLGLAMEIVLTGEQISAKRAYEIGFVNRVVPNDQLMAEAEKIADTILQCGPKSVWAHKELLWRGLSLSHDEGLAMSTHIVAPLYEMEDSKEGPRAFVEKRKPQWELK